MKTVENPFTKLLMSYSIKRRNAPKRSQETYRLAAVRRIVRTLGGLAISILILMLSLTQAKAVTAEPGAAADAQQAEGADEVTITLSRDEAELYKRLRDVMSLIRDLHPKDVCLEMLYEGALKGAAEAVGDPYTQYIGKDQFGDFSSSIEGEYVGIGVTIELVNGKITVVNTFPGSPARQAGVKAGDVITRAAGQDLAGKSLTEAAALLRGPEGTSVSVTIYRPSTGQLLEMNLTRRRIQIPTLDFKDLGDGLKYVAINQFTSETGRNFPAVIKTAKMFGMKGLVLDLRDNPGGTLEDCLEVLKCLVPKGPMVSLVYKEGREEYSNEEDPTNLVPVVVLLNGGTASAAEIVAAAIRDRGVGILVGEKTYGKGTIQAVIKFKNGSGMKLTIGEYLPPGGQSLDGKGLVPDVYVPAQERVLPKKPEATRALRKGMIGLDVLAVQQALAFIGYDVGEPDGIFGSRTESAVKAFQKSISLSPTGIVDAALVGKLFDAVQAFAREHHQDNVLDKAIELLRRKVDTGDWGIEVAKPAA